MSHIHINIGSNLGDRANNIERAVAAIVAAIDPDGHCNVTLAPLTESKPWGYESANDYLNLGLMIDTGCDKVDNPEQLLAQLLDIEHFFSHASHRQPDGTYADRLLDIDLIAIDNMMLDSETLTLPHPRMCEREFVLQPIRALEPEWRHPQTGLTAGQMLASLALINSKTQA